MIFKIQINSQMLVIVESQFIFLPKYKYMEFDLSNIHIIRLSL